MIPPDTTKPGDYTRLPSESLQIRAHPRFGIAGREQIADDGDCCGAGIDDRPGVVDGDTANRDERQISRGGAPRGVRHPFQSDRLVAGLLGRRAEHRADRDVAHWLVERPLQLFHRVRRESDHGVIADNRSNRARRQIFLPHVHPCGARQPRDVGAVVDDDARARGAREVDDGRGCVEEGGTGQVFRANLQKPCAAAEERAGQIDRRPAGPRRGIDVDDRVEPGQEER
jgi:hypothetical protein